MRISEPQLLGVVCTRKANFQNDNYTVGLPVFTIHGNHDDPSGVDNLSAVDVLSTCNLVNYFGKAVRTMTYQCVNCTTAPRTFGRC